MPLEPRVIVRHKGPPGRGLPPGGTTGQIFVKASSSDYDGEWVNPPNGTGAAVGPSSAGNNNVAVFDGTTGKLLKDGGQPLSNYATTSALADKQDRETGKGLSQENFTTTFKNKLNGLAQNYRGRFASTALVESSVIAPVAGDYALVEVSGQPQTVSFWDQTNTQWDHKLTELMTGQQIADVLFDAVDAAAWDQDLCRIFTESDKTKLENHEAAFNSLNLGDLSRPYGSLNYFDLAGTSVPIAAVSNGVTNLVKVDVSAVIGASVSGFDLGESTARLRYTSNATKVFNVTAVVSASIPVNDVCVFGIAKTGSLVASSRVLQKSAASGAAHGVAITAQVSMGVNDYLEVFVGNTTDADDITVHTLYLSAQTV